MFIYKYPDSNKEAKIVIHHPDGSISICNWRSSTKQWVAESDSNWYHEFDTRISGGAIHWCYYSDFLRFMNMKQNKNIDYET